MSLTKEIIKDLSIKYNLSEKRIELIINHLCKFTKDAMGEEGYKCIMWEYLGKFYVKPTVINFWEELKKDPLFIDYRELTPRQRTIIKVIKSRELRKRKYLELLERNKRDNIMIRHDDRNKVQSPTV